MSSPLVGPFGLLLIALSGASLLILVGLAALDALPEVTRVLEAADSAVAVVFLADFAVTFAPRSATAIGFR